MSIQPTYRELLKSGISRLEAAGIDGAREDARFLLFEAARISPSEFIMLGWKREKSPPLKP